MKRFFAFFIITFITLSLSTNAGAQSGTKAASKQQKRTATRPMAAEGEKVWVIINHVKPDKREQFEKFIHEVFWPTARKLRAQEQRVFRQTRVLHPTEAEKDGTYSYIFIMDPLIESGNYDILSLLTNMYGKEKATEYNNMFEETLAREQTQIMTVQSKY
jgi:hypothetical protein